MAKNTLKHGGPARLRLVVLDAEIPDGDLGSLTNALQNALRMPNAAVQRVTAVNGTKGLTHLSSQEDEATDPGDENEMAMEEVEGPRQPRQRTPRKAPPAPKVLDFDIDSEPSLKSYATNLNPKSDHKRFLVIAAWFHLHRKTDAISVDHVYTCFRHLGWSTNIADFAQPLRALKHKQYFTSPETGKYAINHLGLAQVEKLTTGGNVEVE